MIGTTEFSQIYEGISGKLVIDNRLPVTLPQVEKYEPAGDGQSPLATVSDWVNVKLNGVGVVGTISVIWIIRIHLLSQARTHSSIGIM
jgi:hypothetical protein